MKKILMLFVLLSCMVVYGEEIIIENTIPQAYTKEEKNTQNNISPPYMKGLEQRIKRNWYPPKNFKTGLMRTKVSFVIAKNGNLLNSEVVFSSGNKEYDKAALDAIKKTFPYAPLPKEYKDSSAQIEFTFDMNASTTTFK